MERRNNNNHSCATIAPGGVFPEKGQKKLRLGQNLSARFSSGFCTCCGFPSSPAKINQSFSFVTQKQKETPQKYWLQSDRSVLFPKGDNYFPFSFSFFLFGEKNLLTALPLHTCCSFSLVSCSTHDVLLFLLLLLSSLRPSTCGHERRSRCWKITRADTTPLLPPL